MDILVPPVVPPPPPTTIEGVCAICAESYNKSTRLKIQCPYCEFETCRLCCQKYILQESTAKCMNPTCAKEFTRKQVRQLFTQTFVNKDYKTLRENVLWDQERALLPATQPIVERKLRYERLTREMVLVNDEMDRMLRPLRERLVQLHEERAQTARTTATTERAAFVRACPDAECRGYLSTQWKCGLCEKWTCPTCHEIRGYQRDAPHECDPGNVATATLLNHDTKPCPKCGIGIFKIDGCDQMWCTLCHCAFSWRTGRIENHIHNPHYYEWLRRNGGAAQQQTPDDAGGACGRGEITHRFCNQLDMILDNRIPDKTFRDVIKRKIYPIAQGIAHIRIVVLREYQVDHELSNQDLRVRYLTHSITEDEFKVHVQRRDKQRQKKREIYQVFHMMVNTITDMLFRFQAELTALRSALRSALRTTLGRVPCPEPWTTMPSVVAEMDALVDYVNECLRDISVTFGSRMLQVNDKYRVVSVPTQTPQASVVV